MEAERDGDIDTRNDNGVGCFEVKRVQDAEEMEIGLLGIPLKGSISDGRNKIEGEETEGAIDDCDLREGGAELLRTEGGSKGGGALSAVIRLQVALITWNSGREHIIAPH